MIRIGLAATDTPLLPERTWKTRSSSLALAAAVHLVVFAGIWTAMSHSSQLAAARAVTSQAAASPADIEVRRFVFLVREPMRTSSGGGGGGNEQPAPIRRAEAPGHDDYTLRVNKQPAPAPTPIVEPSSGDLVFFQEPPTVLLDALPMASGVEHHVGLPFGGVSSGTSQGPGRGGGVGEGSGTGIGSGEGPGVGPGSGGGTGGGAYRPGGSVSAPRLLLTVKPVYTAEALRQHLEGSVLLEAVVTRQGRASDIRVIRSLDRGLDEQAMIALTQWRFEPGRLNSTPVDVIVTVQVEFTIR